MTLIFILCIDQSLMIILGLIKDKRELCYNIIMNTIDIIKTKIDIIGKKIDITKSKTLMFLATGGSSWIYAMKQDISQLLIFGAWIIFAISMYGIVVNVIRFRQLYTQLERLENDNI